MGGPQRGSPADRDDARQVTWPIVSRLTARRHVLGLTQRDVCDATGMTQSHLSDLERGRYDNPTVLTLVRWARALGYTVEVRIRSSRG